MVDSDLRLARPSWQSADEPAALRGGFEPCGCRSEARFRWYVATTQSHAEHEVERTVRRRGMAVWLPEYLAPNDRLALLFPRYMFFQADLGDSRWQGVYSDRGVDTVLGTRGERPTPIPAGVLELLWQDCTMTGVMMPQESKPAGRLPPIAPGSVVRVSAGRFTGWGGICRWSSAARVSVLLSVMGRDVKVQMPRGDISPA